MTDEKALLLEIGDLFPSIGMVVPYIEIKFRLAAKYGQDVVDTTLEELVQMEKMSKFEFNNQLHYKSKDDIPMAFGSTQSASSGNDGSSTQLDDLSEIVLAIGEALNNASVSDLISKYKSKY